MYFANPTVGSIPHMVDGTIGFIATPRQGQYPPPGVVWCLDNNCFGKEEFNEAKWWKWVQSPLLDRTTCAFVTAPDVVGDAQATTIKSMPWLTRIRELGYRVAFVAQDGCDEYRPPWDEFDVLFIGGTDSFKLGPLPRLLAREARLRNIGVHCGRVNSLKRLRYAEAIGCQSADGTSLIFGPDKRLRDVLHWVNTIHTQKPLFEETV